MSLSGLLGRLFLAKDTELLLAAPLRTGALFGYKLIEGFGSGLLFAFMTLAFFVGYGMAVGAGPLFYAMATIVVMLIMVSMVGIAMFLVLLLARLLPPRRIQALLTLATVPIMIGLVSIFLSSVEVRVGGDGEVGSPDPTSPLLVSGRPPIDVSGAPVARIGRALAHAANDDARAGMLDVIPLLVVGCGAGVLSFGAFRATFYEGRARLSETRHRRRGVDLPQRLALLAPRRYRPLVLKDWRALGRDVRMLSALLAPFALFAFLIAMPLLRGDDEGGAAFLIPLVILPPMLAPTLAASIFGSESQGLLYLRSAPVTTRTILIAKCLSVAIPVGAGGALLTATAGVVLAAHALTSLGFIVGLFVLSGIAAVAASASAGAFYDFDADEPQQAMGCLGTLIPVGLAISSVILVGGIIAWLTAFIARDVPRLPLLIAGAVLSAASTAWVAAVVALWRRAERRLATWPE